MPVRIPISISPDGFTKVGTQPWMKWVVTTSSGDKFYQLLIKETLADPEKEVINA